MSDSTASSETGSYFLGIPLGRLPIPCRRWYLANGRQNTEIRRQIYDYLLLDPPCSFLSEPLDDEDNSTSTEMDQMWDDDEYQGDFYEHNFFSEDASDRDYAALALNESKMQHGHKAPWEEEDTDHKEEDGADQETKVERFPAILRTNRQIYSEASSLFYTGLQVHLQPGDFICMNAGKDIVKASGIWRHNPLRGIGTTNQSGQTVYATPELDGFMEPHVFARFTNIICDFEFSWQMDTLEAVTGEVMTEDEMAEERIAPRLFVNDDLTVDRRDKAELLAYYRSSTMIHQLFKILSNSHNIVCLEMFFDIEVLARYDMNMDIDFEENEDEDDDDDEEGQFKKMDVANECATDLFLDSGLLAPLEKLSNVQTFKFDVLPQDFGDEPDDCIDEYRSSPKQARVLNALKQKIEGNYAVKDV